MDLLLDTLSQAKTSIDICVYDLTHPLIVNKLIDLTSNGVKIKMITDNKRLNDKSEELAA